jgi:hypothetical protein
VSLAIEQEKLVSRVAAQVTRAPAAIPVRLAFRA